MRRTSLLVLIPSVIAFFGVLFYTYAATTISTNIETAGTLTVTGISALTGAVTTTGAATIGGILTVTGATVLSSTLTVANTTTFSNTVTISGARGLVLGISTAGSPPATVAEGMIYYDTTNNVLKLYDGAAWFTVGTTTSGLALSGSGNSKITLSDLATQYMTFGTTTQTGFSVLTLTATTSTSIPLTIRGEISQSANLLQIQNIAGTSLLTVGPAGNTAIAGTLTVTGLTSLNGNASTTMLSTTNGTGNLWVGGFATTTGSNGNFATQGTLTVTGTGATTLGGILTVTGVSTFTGQGIFLGGASTTDLTLLNAETIDNKIDGVIRTNATSSVNGFATTTANGIIMPASVITASPVACGSQYAGGLFWSSARKVLCVCDGTSWQQATTSTTIGCIY